MDIQTDMTKKVHIHIERIGEGSNRVIATHMDSLVDVNGMEARKDVLLVLNDAEIAVRPIYRKVRGDVLHIYTIELEVTK